MMPRLILIRELGPPPGGRSIDEHMASSPHTENGFNWLPVRKAVFRDGNGADGKVRQRRVSAR